MATIALTAATFDPTVDAGGIVLVDFWASWCGPCRQFGPIFEEASERHAGVTFGKVDTEAEQAFAGQFGIVSIPTVMAFRDGVLVYNQAGAIPGAGLDDLIGKIQALDMDQVRETMAAQDA